MSFQEQNGSEYLTADTRRLDLGSAGASSAQAGPAGLFARTHNGGEIPSSALTNAFNHSDGDGNVTFLVYTIPPAPIITAPIGPVSF